MFNPDTYQSYSEYLKIMTKYFNSDNPAPFISARSWVMMNRDTKQLMYAKQENEQRQVASLTKVMTCTIVLELLSKWKLDPSKMMVNILHPNTTEIIGGTTAELITGDRICVKELLYGMMLPSGNDAAQSLGCYFGQFVEIIDNYKKKPAECDANIKLEDFCDEEELEKMKPKTPGIDYGEEYKS